MIILFYVTVLLLFSFLFKQFQFIKCNFTVVLLYSRHRTIFLTKTGFRLVRFAFLVMSSSSSNISMFYVYGNIIGSMVRRKRALYYICKVGFFQGNQCIKSYQSLILPFNKLSSRALTVWYILYAFFNSFLSSKNVLLFQRNVYN